MQLWFVLFIAENILIVCMFISYLILLFIDNLEKKRQNKINAYASLCSKYGDSLINNIKDII